MVRVFYTGVSSMRGSTGCIKYTGLYRVSQVWRFLRIVSSTGVSKECPMVRVFYTGVSSMRGSTV